MRQVIFRTVVMVLASMLAHAASPTFAQNIDDDARRPPRTRPIADFLEQQGQHLTKGLVPEFLAFTAYFNPDTGTNRAASIDYAGLGAAVIQQQTRGKVALGTQMDGIVRERPLPDGRAEVTVQLHTRNAFFRQTPLYEMYRSLYTKPHLMEPKLLERWMPAGVTGALWKQAQLNRLFFSTLSLRPMLLAQTLSQMC